MAPPVELRASKPRGRHQRPRLLRAPLAVTKVISQHQGPGRRFSFPDIHPGEFDVSWFQSRALSNLEELDIGYASREIIPLPLFVLRSAATLLVLKISKCDFPGQEIVPAIDFPLLKQLSLIHVSISGDVLHGLLSGCHALESLFMSQVRTAGFLRVRSPTLRTICLSRRSRGIRELFIEDAPRLVRVLIPYSQQDHCLTIRVIRAPKLEVLGPAPFKTPKNQDILSDSLDFSKFRIFQGMYPVSSTNPMRTVKVLALRSSGRELHAVLNVLGWFPSLEKLSVIFYIHHEKDKKNEPQYDPRRPIECLQTHLKKVVFKSYIGYEKQLDFARFFILNAKVLSKMEFEGHDRYINNTVTYQHKMLQVENRASRDAEFEFRIQE